MIMQHSERIVKDTVVITAPSKLVGSYDLSQPLRLDTGRLRLTIWPLTIDGPQTEPHKRAMPSTHHVHAECLPETLHIPKVVRERVHERCACPPARNSFWHYSGWALWLLLAVGFTVFILRKS